MKFELFELFSKEIINNGIYEVQIYEDMHVKKIWTSPFTIISATNETQNKILFYDNKDFENLSEIEKILNQNPDERFEKVDFKLKNGDVIKLKILNRLRKPMTVKILFLIETGKKENGRNKIHTRRFKAVRNK